MPQAPDNFNLFESLMQIVRSLRGPEGCPWDKEQTHQTLTPYAIEEVYEFVEAIESKNDTLIKDELGDVLFQVALHAALAEERGAFQIQDVIANICEKLVRRHPHVFSDVTVTGIDDVWKNWEEIKKNEKKNSPKKSAGPFDFPNHLPALQRAHKIGVKSQKLKFDWDSSDGVLKKVWEEIGELQDAKKEMDSKGQSHPGSIEYEAVEEEFGDVLFSLSQWARHQSIEPEAALRKANKKFEDRFNTMMDLVARDNKNWDQMPDNEKEHYWAKAKVLVKTISGLKSDSISS
ncbi:MAG: nucleoside triphosphate pyrophosphohydrolase [Bdellovibrionaceae bacterium]|nr:nucleoside triphosphate pyrophosphohydrolase [Pseudobdellovibrionaceae bacterium]